MSALAINGVGLRLGESGVLNNVSLTVPQGKITALLGPARAGKTALLRAIAGLEAPQAGTIRIGEDTVFDAVTKVVVPPEKRGIGLMFQSGALWPHWSVRDNLAFIARLRGTADDEAKAQANRLLDRLSLIEIGGHKPAQLSARDRQRAALGRALIGAPRLLLLDEPLGGLEADTGERMWLRQLLTEAGITTLIATRDRMEAFALAEHVAIMNAGAIEQAGAPADIFTKPATPFVANFMAPCTGIEGTLVEKAGPRAFIEVMGTRIGGVNCTDAALGETCTGMIRIERVLIGGGPGLNRLGMKLASQTYLGERWEIAFVSDARTVRAHATAPLRHEFYHVEFPPDALWIY